MPVPETKIAPDPSSYAARRPAESCRDWAEAAAAQRGCIATPWPAGGLLRIQ